METEEPYHKALHHLLQQKATMAAANLAHRKEVSSILTQLSYRYEGIVLS